MPVCAAGCDFFTDSAAVCTKMQAAATLGPGRSECGAIYIGFFYTCRILEIHIILVLS